MRTIWPSVPLRATSIFTANRGWFRGSLAGNVSSHARNSSTKIGWMRLCATTRYTPNGRRAALSACWFRGLTLGRVLVADLLPGGVLAEATCVLGVEDRLGAIVGHQAQTEPGQRR